jgi:hypothetical protein
MCAVDAHYEIRCQYLIHFQSGRLCIPLSEAKRRKVVLTRVLNWLEEIVERFNTLNAISSLVVSKQPELATEMIAKRIHHQIARINRMRSSIFFATRARSGPRFCSKQIPQKNVTIRPARESLSFPSPRAAVKLSISS